MFNVTHTSKPGLCMARRCKGEAVQDRLCDRHYAEWNAEGKPPFGAEGTAMVTDSAIPNGLREHIAEARGNALRVLELSQALEVTTQAGMDTAGAWLASCRQYSAAMAKRADEILAPLKATVKGVQNEFVPVISVYTQIESTLRAKMNNHVAAQTAAQSAAREQVEAAQGNVTPDTLVVAHGVENIALPVGMGVREAWDYEITDEVAFRNAYQAGQIPAEAMQPNHDWLKRVVREYGDHAVMAGVRVFKKTSVIAARRTS